MSRLTDKQILGMFHYDMGEVKITRMHSYLIIIPKNPYDAAIFMRHDKRILSIDPYGIIFIANDCLPPLLFGLNMARALLARAGVAFPDLRGRFINRNYGLSGIFAAFIIPTPNGPPVQVACNHLDFAPDGRIASVFANSLDMDASSPNLLERALVRELNPKKPHSGYTRAHDRDIVALYRLRGGDPESRFTPKFLATIEED